MIHKSHQIFNPVGQKAITLAILVALGISAIPIFNLISSREASQKLSTAPSITIPVENAVSALGRLQPQGEVIKLSAPTALQNAKIEQLLVEKEGDSVAVGQVVAILDNRDRLQAAVEQAEKQIELAQANKAKITVGAKEGEIEAQKAQIARLKAQLNREKTAGEATVARYEATKQGNFAAQTATVERYESQLNNAKAEFKRNQELYDDGVISASVLDAKRMAWETAQAQVTEAKANLNRSKETDEAQLTETKANFNRTVDTLKEQINEAIATLDKIKEVRPTDVKAAQAEVDRSISALKQAKKDLDLAYVKSPIAGQVLKIHTRPGETVSKDGIVELGKTAQMYVVAEVYESDIGKVNIGQRATIKSATIDSILQGNVVEKGWKIAKKDVLNTDPASDVDARVVEVKISLDPVDSKKVADLTNLQVDVTINL